MTNTIHDGQRAFRERFCRNSHEHYHSQVTNVAKGAFEVTIAGVSKVMKQGDCFYIPPHIVHGVVCLEDGLLIDVFSPIREDFMQKMTY